MLTNKELSTRRNIKLQDGVVTKVYRCKLNKLLKL